VPHYLANLKTEITFDGVPDSTSDSSSMRSSFIRSETLETPPPPDTPYPDSDSSSSEKGDSPSSSEKEKEPTSTKSDLKRETLESKGRSHTYIQKKGTEDKKEKRKTLSTPLTSPPKDIPSPPPLPRDTIPSAPPPPIAPPPPPASAPSPPMTPPVGTPKAEGRNELLSNIRNFNGRKLKKVETVDKSGALLSKPAGPGSGNNPGGGLMAEVLASRRKVLG